MTPAPLVKLIGLPGLPERGDLADWIVLEGAVAGPDDRMRRLEAIADTVESERNAPSMDDPTRFRPLPVDDLPEPVRGFVAGGASAFGCDPSYLALPLLTALASALGNTRRLELKPVWEAPPLLWSVIVGENGFLTTPAFKRAMKPFRKREAKAMMRNAEAMQRYAEDLARWEKDATAWQKGKNNSDKPPVEPVPPRPSGTW